MNLSSIRSPDDSQYRAVGQYIKERTGNRDLVVVPYILDVCISHYSDAALEQRIWRIWKGDVWRDLLFVARHQDPRFSLSSYTLTTNFVESKSSIRTIELPEQAFSVVKEFGPLSIYRLKQPANSVEGIENLITSGAS